MLFSSADFRQRALPIAASQGVGVLCGIGGIALVSRWISPVILGAYGVYLTFTTLGMWLVHLGLTKFLNRQWASTPDRPALLREVMRQWIRKLGWLALAAALAAGAMTRSHRADWLVLFPVLLISAALLSIFAMAQAALQADRAHWADFGASAVGSVARTFFPPILYWASGKQILWLYAGFLLHAAAAAAMGAWLLRRHWRQPPPRALALTPARTGVRVHAIYLGPLFTVLAAASWMLLGLNRWIVAVVFGEQAAGLFTLASNMAVLLPSVLGAMFLQYFQPGLYSLMDTAPGGDGKALLRRVDWIVAALGLSGLAALLFLRSIAPALIGTLIKASYLGALRWILPSGCFGLAIATNQFFHVALLAARRERACAVVDLSSAAALTVAAVGGAWAGEKAYWWALTLTPLCTWTLTRTLARAVFASKRGEAATP